MWSDAMMANGTGVSALAGYNAMRDERRFRKLRARIVALEKLAAGLSNGKLLSSKEVALILGFHRKTIEKWTRFKGNPLPCIRRGRTLRFRISDVNRWVAQRKEG